MWGAIAGAAISLGSGIIGAIQARKAAKKQKQYLDKVEQNASEDYQHAVGANRASIQAALTRGKENMMTGINAAQGTAAVMGGDTAATRQMKEAAVAQAAEGGRQGAALQEQANNAAYQQYSQTRKEVGMQRAGLAGQQSQQSALAGSYGIQAGMGLLQADLQSHLDTGKGTFENALSKNSLHPDQQNQQIAGTTGTNVVDDLTKKGV